jgi:hypothetical protein
MFHRPSLNEETYFRQLDADLIVRQRIAQTTTLAHQPLRAASVETAALEAAAAPRNSQR